MPPKGAKVLCDQGVPAPLVAALRGRTSFEYSFAYLEGVAEVDDMDVLMHAEANNYSVLLTNDKSLVHQQNLQKLRVSIVILGSNKNEVCLAHAAQVVQAIQSVTGPGRVIPVRMALPEQTKRKKRK
jgi:predicted nuclease of predicted toxin-antitoxin system